MPEASQAERQGELRRAVAAVEARSSATADLPPLSAAAHEAAGAGLSLLRHRPRSEHELRGRLADKEFDAEAVDEAVSRLRVWGLLDDADFAQEWVRGRRRRRGRSAGALRRELQEKGVAEVHIADALAGITESDERERARELVAERVARSAGAPVPDPRDPAHLAVRRRLVAFLERRGYPGGLALSVVDEVLAEER